MIKDSNLQLLEPKRKAWFSSLRDFWQHRVLLGYVILHFMRRLYHNTLIGWAWLVLRPLVPVVITVIVLGKIAGISTGKTPYLLFVLASLGLWSIFGSSLRLITRSFNMGKGFTRDAHFPKILIPTAALLFSMIRFGIYLVITALALGFFYFQDQKLYLEPSFKLAILPLYVLAMMFFTLGIGFVTSILNTRKRDMQFTAPYIANLGLFLTPVLYPVSLVPTPWRFWVHINPLTGLMEGYRYCLFDQGQIFMDNQIYSFTTCVVIFAMGLHYLKRHEKELDRS